MRAQLLVLLLAYVGFMISRMLSLPSGPSHVGTAYLSEIAKFQKETKFLSDYVAQKSFLVIGGTRKTRSPLFV